MRRDRFVTSAFGLLVLLIFAAGTQSVHGQSSVINVPTTDVLPPQKVYVELDYFTHPTPHRNGGFHSFGPSIIYGVSKNVEVGLNVYYTVSSEPAELELQPNAKWQFYSDEESGFAAAAGAIVSIPLKNRTTTNTTAVLYLTLGQQIKKKYGPRITAGTYGFIGKMEEGETRGGILLGLEQPLHSKVMFVADWLSGNNVFGYASAGLGITLPKESYLYAGYSFGNQGPGNNFLGIFFGRTF